jgi:hypothetical protein
MPEKITRVQPVGRHHQGITFQPSFQQSSAAVVPRAFTASHLFALLECFLILSLKAFKNDGP